MGLFDGIAEAPVNGAYSHTKLDGGCHLKFFKTYIEKEERVDANKFDTQEGLAIHAFAELDIENLGDDVSVEDRIDRLLMVHPEWADLRYELSKSAELFRKRFVPTISQDDIVGSELELGANLNMEPMGFWETGCWYRGKVDYIERVGDKIRVVDFKNYPRIHDDEELEQKGYGVGAQLMGYIALAMAIDPTLKYGVSQIYYTRYGVIKEAREVTRDEVEKWWRFNQTRMIALEKRRSWSAQPSRRACSYCPFLDTCTYSKGPESYVARNDSEATDMAKRLLVAEELVARLKVGIDAFITHTGKDRVTVDGEIKVGYVERIDREVNSETVFQIAHEAGLDPFDYVKATYTSTKALAKKITDPESIERLLGAVTEVKKTSKRYA